MTLREEVQMVTGTSRALRVLIVDDEAVACDSTALLLKLWGFETVVTDSGPKALHAAQVHSPDIILLDIALPKMDGLHVAQCLREQTPPNGKRPVLIALCGSRDPEIRQRCHEAGVNLYCVKPFNPMILEKAALAASQQPYPDIVGDYANPLRGCGDATVL
jgi:CheY-like chemotaxis protein